MDTILHFFTQLYLDIHLIGLIEVVFIGLIYLQIATLLVCGVILASKGLAGDIMSFLKDYWKWDHLQHNVGTLSLWCSSLGAYLSLWLISKGIADVQLAGSLTLKPLAVIYVCLGLLGFIIYTLRKSHVRILSMIDVANELNKIRQYKSFKQVLKKARGTEYGKSIWGGWVKPVTQATEWVGDKLVTNHIDNEIRGVILTFATTAALEYILRMSIVLVAILSILL